MNEYMNLIGQNARKASLEIINNKIKNKVLKKYISLLDNEKNGRVEGIDRTPVPGGVGPMTVAMLLENTVISWVRRLDATTTTRASYDDDQQKIICNIAEELAPPIFP